MWPAEIPSFTLQSDSHLKGTLAVVWREDRVGMGAGSSWATLGKWEYQPVHRQGAGRTKGHAARWWQRAPQLLCALCHQLHISLLLHRI